MTIKTRVAVSRNSSDKFPVFFRPDCERTLFDPISGTDEGLFDLVRRLDAAGYDLIDLDELVEEPK